MTGLKLQFKYILFHQNFNKAPIACIFPSTVYFTVYTFINIKIHSTSTENRNESISRDSLISTIYLNVTNTLTTNDLFLRHNYSHLSYTLKLSINGDFTVKCEHAMSAFKIHRRLHLFKTSVLFSSYHSSRAGCTHGHLYSEIKSVDVMTVN